MRPLSRETLERFWAVSRAAGAPIADELSPRLSVAELAELMAPLGVTLPPELSTLWSYGVPPAPGTNVSSSPWEMTPDFALLPPEVVVDETRKYRDTFPPEDFSPTALVVATGVSWYSLLIDCAEQEEMSRVYYFTETWAPLGSHSLGALFELWTDQITEGEHAFRGGRWRVEEEIRGAVFSAEELEQQKP